MDGIDTRIESSANIVVIDDDCDSLDYLTTLLARKGIHCVAFCDPTAALNYIRAHAVSVVVTDIFMPDVDGVELITAIGKCRPETAVIALSGYPQSYLRCMKMLGAVAGMAKPVDPAALVSAVGGCLAGAVA
jgi:two-component system phosphoglycerate transport system response regulator PgtA